MTNLTGAAPKISLSRWQWIRLVIVAVFAAFSLLRVVPEAVRLTEPLGFFNYLTDYDGVVVQSGAAGGKGMDALQTGDRVRIDRVKPFDRKPGLVRLGYTRLDFERWLPIERNGRERVLHIKAVAESQTSRGVVALRVVIFIISVIFGSLLVIVKPNVATVGFFAFAIGGEYSTTFSSSIFNMPWRQYPQWIGDTIRGTAPVGLCVFALCFVFVEARIQRVIAVVAALVAAAVGSLHAYAFWRIAYAGLPAQAYANVGDVAYKTIGAITAIAFIVSLIRSRGAVRQRTGWIVASFAVAALARVLSDTFFPRSINYWENGILLSATVVPVIVVWIAVVRHNVFDVDFVMSRGLIYMAVFGGVIGAIGSADEVASWVFVNNTELGQFVAYGIVIVFAAFVSQFQRLLVPLIDRFVFPGRRAQRGQLERIATNILEATTAGEVYNALLQDVPSVLDLSFGGIMMRTADGGFSLSRAYDWPENCLSRLEPDHPLVVEIDRSRGLLALEDPRSTMIKSTFPHERLTFAAPLHYDRAVSGLLFYGHSVSGVDIDPDERLLLVMVVTRASIALGAIELAKYRAAAERVGAVPQAAPNA